MKDELGTAFDKLSQPVDMLSPEGVVKSIALILMHRNDDTIKYDEFRSVCTEDEFNQARTYVFG